MRKLLLFDKHHITLHGLLRAEEGSAFPKTCSPSKPDGPVISADKPWESGCINWVSMRSENGTMRLWYEAKESSSFNDCDTRLCYAESRDGIHWVKPNLGICEFNGSRDNNIILDAAMHGKDYGLESSYVDNFMVFRDDNPLCPDEKRYKALAYMEFKVGEERRFRLRWYYASDAIHFKHGGVITEDGFFDTLNGKGAVL